jgi:RES domain-containing protein
VIVFRLTSRRYLANDGLGASVYGGRWNHKGIAVIYTAESRALCALEMLVNSDELAGDYVTVPIDLPDEIAVQVISTADLPQGWDASEATDVTRDIGTNWATGLATAVLSVPSAVIPKERNYILNPAHPDFTRIVFASPEPFDFDDRLGRERRKAR